MIGVENFVEIYVDTPLEVCEERDTKGFYAKARRGEITNFTGIDAPYEPPSNPELTLNTVDLTAEDNALAIIGYLLNEDLIREVVANGNGNGQQD